MIKVTIAILLLSSLPVLAASGRKAAADLSVSNAGLILRTAAQSCVDASTPSSPPLRSLTPAVARWGVAKLTWNSSDLDLYVGQIKVTVSSPNLPGGSFVATLDSDEIETMFGIPNSIVSHSVNAGVPVVLDSTSTTKGTTSVGLHAAPCGLAIGGLPIDESHGTFTAKVEITMMGTAFDPQGKQTEQTIQTSTSTTATFY